MYQLRLLKKSDIPQAAKIVGKNYPKKWEKICVKELQEMFGKSVVRPVYFVAEENETIIGFAGYMQSWIDYAVYQIFWVNVLPEKQGFGAGKKLVAKIISEIKKHKEARLILLAADESVSNQRYYAKNFGFRSLQTYGNSPDHLMALRIN